MSNIKDEVVLLSKNSGEEIINSVYRFINENGEVVYIGKAKNLKNRLNNHKHLSGECYSETVEIHYTVFNTVDDMDLAERYLISKLKPKYNEIYKKKQITITIDDFEGLTWYKYDDSKALNEEDDFSSLTLDEKKVLLKEIENKKKINKLIQELEDVESKKKELDIEIKTLRKIDNFDGIEDIINDKYFERENLNKKERRVKKSLMQYKIGHENFESLPHWKQELYSEYLSTDREYIIKSKLDEISKTIFEYMSVVIDREGSFEVSMIYFEISKYFATVGGYGDTWLKIIDENVFDRNPMLSQREVEGVQQYCETVYRKSLLKLQVERNRRVCEEVIFKKKPVFFTSEVEIEQPILIVKFK